MTLRNLFFLAMLSCIQVAKAADMEVPKARAIARLTTSLVPSERIAGLQWDGTAFPVIHREVNGKTLYFVKIQAINEGGFSVVRYVAQGKRYELFVKGQSTFVLEVPLRAGRNRVDVTAVSGDGLSSQEAIYLNSNFTAASSPILVEIGLASAYVDYSEDFGSDHFEIKEVGLTGKLAASYSFSEKAEIGLGGFFTLIPAAISRAPKDISPSRFYGVNGRLGYRVFKFSERAELFLMAGYYLWGQIVPGPIGPSSYGVSSLGGPQLFLSTRFKSKDGRPYFIYAKFAAIQDGQKFVASNSEVAAGAGLQLTDALEPRHWLLTLDATRSRYQGNKLGLEQSFKLFSINLGISTNL